MFVENNLQSLAKPEDVSNLPPSTHVKRDRKKAPAIYNEWPGSPKDKYKADTHADETNYVVRCYSGNADKYFDSLETATLWSIKYLVKGRSPKKESDINKVSKAIENATKPGASRCYGFNWEIKEVN